MLSPADAFDIVRFRDGPTKSCPRIRKVVSSVIGRRIPQQTLWMRPIRRGAARMDAVRLGLAAEGKEEGEMICALLKCIAPPGVARRLQEPMKPNRKRHDPVLPSGLRRASLFTRWRLNALTALKYNCCPGTKQRHEFGAHFGDEAEYKRLVSIRYITLKKGLSIWVFCNLILFAECRKGFHCKRNTLYILLFQRFFEIR